MARKFAEKMDSPLIYCSASYPINVSKIFKIIIGKTFDIKPKVKEAHDETKEALIEFSQHVKSFITIIVTQIYQIC